MCGIFAYLNYCTPKRRDEIVNILVQALHKLAFKSYDSAGLVLDGKAAEGGRELVTVKHPGDISGLEEKLDFQRGLPGEEGEDVRPNHVAMAHTRWATHGPPSLKNTHPVQSNSTADFVVVHNGWLTNFKELKAELLEADPYTTFETETDTEVVAKLALQIYEHSANSEGTKITFREIVEQVCLKLDGAYALVFKSRHYPNECVAATRSSPLLIGIKTLKHLWTNHIPVYFTEDKHPRGANCDFSLENGLLVDNRGTGVQCTTEEGDTTTIRPNSPPAKEQSNKESKDKDSGVEYFFSSESSAIKGHTDKVIQMKNDDIAVVSSEGVLSLHRIKRSKVTATSPKREGQQTESTHLPPSPRTIDILDTKVSKPVDIHSLLLREIHEQVDSICNTMRGRVRFDKTWPGVILGGILNFVPEIHRCRRILLIGSGTSYHVALATRQVLEELTEFAVMVDQASDFLDRGTPVFRDDVCFFLSQSGEHEDILQALSVCRREGALIVGITNTVGSTLSKQSHCGIHLNTGTFRVAGGGQGPEGGSLRSIKAFSSQFIALVMFGLVLSEDICSKQDRRQEIIQGLANLPSMMEKVYKDHGGSNGDSPLLKVAEKLRHQKSLIILGRGYMHGPCAEGALKIKEYCGIHSEACLSGEKANLSLVSKNMATLMVISKDKVHHKSLDVLRKIRESCNPTVICGSDDYEVLGITDNCISLPNTVDCLQGILTVMVMQLLTYHLAKIK